MASGYVALAIAVVLAATEPIPEMARRRVLVATAVEPLRTDKLADALRTYLDVEHVEVRVAPAVSSGDLRADMAATIAAGAGERATAAVRIAVTPADTVEIALSHLPSERTVITTIPSVRDEDLYRTLALKVQGLLRTLEEPPSTGTAAPLPRPSQVDLLAGFTTRTFPLGDVTQEGLLLRGRWATPAHLHLGLGLRLLPVMERKSGKAEARMRAVPFLVTLERLWRGDRFELSAGLVVLAETRHAQATAGESSRSDWAFVPGGGVSLALAVRLARALRLSLHAAAIGLPWSSRYRVEDVTVFDATRLEIPVDLTLNIGL